MTFNRPISLALMAGILASSAMPVVAGVNTCHETSAGTYIMVTKHDDGTWTTTEIDMRYSSLCDKIIPLSRNTSDEQQVP